MGALSLSILTVTYNSAGLIDDLLGHLRNELGDLAAEVIVVDNASRDGTAEHIRRHHPWVHLIASTENLGFAAGNNRGAAKACGDVLLLLNPDALPAPGALRRGVALMQAHPEVGLGGGSLLAPDGTRQPSARMFPALRDELFTLSGLASRYPHSRLFARLDRRWADPTVQADVDWIPGAFVFMPRRVFSELGGFDERFFMYYEEVDLCRRMRAAGYRVRYWPELQATHIGGASAKTVEKARISRAGSQLESWRLRSALLYYRKHHGMAGACGVAAIEYGWHRLRSVSHRLRGRAASAADFALHCAQVREAWRDTGGGRISPPHPW